ncbi:hypothetical protein [Planococcus sp. S3-L1]|uniref:hypothetical protein n=1 Tax=Planococcus sp. S3-L1 TaxID=3046200 RepID=UPI0024BAD021|nr:hypothetical protein [Planococcus sp. S3-L1]MDJ0331719.1 hypothetical protein [Planococcus sp. S3-L1]
MKKYTVWIVTIILLALIVPVSIVGNEKYQEYKLVKELEEEIASIELALDTGDYSSIETESYANSLTLSNFSANSDGTYVNGFGTITNTSTEYISKIGQIAFFNSDGSINKVNNIQVELAAGEVLHFEELIGLTREGTIVPSSAELTGF